MAKFVAKLGAGRVHLGVRDPQKTAIGAHRVFTGEGCFRVRFP